MNGISKIKRWLDNRGYKISFVGSEMYRHNDSFHKGEIYFLDIYRTSNGYYIKYKTHDRPRYYLTETSEGLHTVDVIDFSQWHFIERIKKYFPNMR